VFVLRCLLFVAPGLEAKAERAAEIDSLSRQVVELYQAGKYEQAIPIGPAAP